MREFPVAILSAWCLQCRCQVRLAKSPAGRRGAVRVAAGSPPPLPFSWLRNGASGLRVRHDFPLLLFMIRGVVSPDPEASTDR
jgi:hypothetical protein